MPDFDFTAITGLGITVIISTASAVLFICRQLEQLRLAVAVLVSQSECETRRRELYREFCSGGCR